MSSFERLSDVKMKRKVVVITRKLNGGDKFVSKVIQFSEWIEDDAEISYAEELTFDEKSVYALCFPSSRRHRGILKSVICIK